MRPLLVRWATIWTFCVDSDWEEGFARRADVQRAFARSYPVRFSVFFFIQDVWDIPANFLAACAHPCSLEGDDQFCTLDASRAFLPLEQALLRTYVNSGGVRCDADPYWDASQDTHVAACQRWGLDISR